MGTIIDRSMFWGSLAHLQRLIAFVDNVFNLDGWNQDAIYYAVLKKSKEIVEYVLSMDEIKKKYDSDNDALFRLVSVVNTRINEKEIVKCVVDTLGLTEAKLEELNEYRAIDISKIIPFTK